MGMLGFLHVGWRLAIPAASLHRALSRATPYIGQRSFCAQRWAHKRMRASRFPKIRRTTSGSLPAAVWIGFRPATNAERRSPSRVSGCCNSARRIRAGFGEHRRGRSRDSAMSIATRLNQYGRAGHSSPARTEAGWNSLVPAHEYALEVRGGGDYYPCESCPRTGLRSVRCRRSRKGRTAALDCGNCCGDLYRLAGGKGRVLEGRRIAARGLLRWWLIRTRCTAFGSGMSKIKS